MNPSQRVQRVVRSILSHNRRYVSRWFVGSEPRLFAVQEVFWSCAAELVGSELLGKWPRGRIRAGRDQSALRVKKEQWNELRQGLGLDDPELRQRLTGVLQSFFFGTPEERKRTSYRLTEPLPLALVLMTGVLERLGRNGIPLSFVLDLSEMERVAYEDLAWVEIGEINSAGLARRLLSCTDTPLDRDPDLLEIPFRGYWRRLVRSLDYQGPPVSRGQTGSLPENFLVEGLRAAEEPAELEPPAVPTPVFPADEEVGELYERLEEMERMSPARLLPQILGPLLGTADDPLEALEAAAASAEGLARDLTLACRTLLRSGDVELIGRVGEILELTLPCQDYQLERTGPMRGRDVSRGRFRVGRRGIRCYGSVVLPAKVSRST